MKETERTEGTARTESTERTAKIFSRVRRAALSVPFLSVLSILSVLSFLSAPSVWAQDEASFAQLTLDPAVVQPGQGESVSILLNNESASEWPARTYRAAVLIKRKGKKFHQTNPIDVSKAIPSGQSRKLHFLIFIPKSASGPLTFQVLLMKGDRIIARSEPVEAQVAGKAPGASAGGGSGTYAQALSAFRPRLNPAAFSQAYLSGANSLILQANQGYASASAGEQTNFVYQAATDWSDTLKNYGLSTPGFLLSVLSPVSGGSLWSFKDNQASAVDQWADENAPYSGPTQPAAQHGKLLGYLGGQYLNGNANLKTVGVNGRLGTTLFHDKYDVSAIFSYSSIGSSPAEHVSSYGVNGRALFPVNEKWGWNVGGQLEEDAATGTKTETNLSVLGGLNFYLPGGSLDMTLQLGTHSIYGFLVGYTFYFTR